MNELDILGIKYGTDKSRLSHDYLRQYQRVLQPYLNREICLLEIGIHNGASLKVWKEFLPKAQIVGVDIAPVTKKFEEERVAVEIGSQADPEFLAEIGQKYRPDIIVDDGSHIEDHQIISFQHLFKNLQEGGIYIIEDVPNFGKELKSCTYFSDLQRQVLLRMYPDSISSIECIPGCFIIRKTSYDGFDSDLERLEKLVHQSLSPEAHVHFTLFVRNRNLPVERKIEVVQTAIAKNPGNPWCFLYLGQILASDSRYREALDAIDEAERLSPHSNPVFENARHEWEELATGR